MNTAQGQRDYCSRGVRILLANWFKYGKKQASFVDFGADCERKRGVLRAENMRVKICKLAKTGDFAGINSGGCKY